MSSAEDNTVMTVNKLISIIVQVRWPDHWPAPPTDIWSKLSRLWRRSNITNCNCRIGRIIELCPRRNYLLFGNMYLWSTCWDDFMLKCGWKIIHKRSPVSSLRRIRWLIQIKCLLMDPNGFSFVWNTEIGNSYRNTMIADEELPIPPSEIDHITRIITCVCPLVTLCCTDHQHH